YLLSPYFKEISSLIGVTLTFVDFINNPVSLPLTFNSTPFIIELRVNNFPCIFKKDLLDFNLSICILVGDCGSPLTITDKLPFIVVKFTTELFKDFNSSESSK